MSFTHIKVFVATIAFSLSLTNPSYAQEENDRDFQVRNDTTLLIPLKKNVDSSGKTSNAISFLVLGTLRLGQNRLFPVDRRIGLGIDFRLNRSVSVMPSYLYRSAEPLRGRKESEHRLRFEANIEKKWDTFSLKDRNRIEYRKRHSSDDSVGYRNRLTLKIPIKIDGKEALAPFVADEIFYDIGRKRLFRNEISVGISRKISEAVDADLYYLRQDNRAGIVRSINVIGVSLKITLDKK